MKQVYRIDSDGFYIEPVIIEDDQIIPSDCVELRPLDGLFKGKYTNGEWTEGLSQDEIDNLIGNTLENVKKNKLEELNNMCENTILGRFKANLDGVEYEFSYDDKAQSRFNGAPYLFSSMITTSIEWTAYLDNQRTSVILDEEKFNIVANAAFNHQKTNIDKFRQKITDLDAAQSIPEVNQIVW